VHFGMLPTEGVAGASTLLTGMLLTQPLRPGVHAVPRAPPTSNVSARQQRISPQQTWASAPSAPAMTLAPQRNLQHPRHQLPAYWAIQPHAWHRVHAPQADSHHGLPPALYRLLDPAAAVELPPCGPGRQVPPLDNRELDKLVAGLGRSKATWRRALMLHQWLMACGHAPDARLATTLIRVCSQHGQALAALGLYDWMRATRASGGGSLTPTVFTYTAAMRAALAGNLLSRAFQVWADAVADGCEPDCRMATTLIEVCARAGDTQRAIRTYDSMRAAPPGSRMAPSVHAYTAAMRAAAEGGCWQRALDMWDDMAKAACRPTGHAFAAVISACAAGGEWRRGAALFDEMRNRWGIKPDVVSCTALVTAFGTDGQWSRAQQVVDWMHSAGIRPNVRTYTALVAALGRGGQWERAQRLLSDMRRGFPWGGAEPNAYTYSALLKSMGEQGRWELAEQVFSELEAEALGRSPSDPAQPDVVASTPTPALYSAPAAATPGSEGPSNSGSLWGHASSSALPSLPVGLRTLPDELSGSDMSASDECSTPMGTTATFRRSSSNGSFNPLESYGLLPTSIAEQVLDGSLERVAIAATLPDDLPGQSNCGASDAADASFISQHSQLAPPRLDHLLEPATSTAHWLQEQPLDVQLAQQQQQKNSKAARSPVNEVVCGAMMHAYEHAGQADKCLGMLVRAQRLGIPVNMVMMNTAMSALAKARRTSEAVALFGSIPQPNAVSFEVLVAAHGLVGDAPAAEAALAAMYAAGLQPSGYAYVALISAHSLAGDFRSALGVKSRVAAAGVPMSVHLYNGLIAAAERAGAWEAGIKLREAMAADGIAPNTMTNQLMAQLSQGGVSFVETQQVAVAALSAAVAAAGTALVSAGAF